MNIASVGLLADSWGTNGHMGGGWWIVMMIWMVLFWGAVIFGIVWLIRSVAGGGPSPSGETPVSRETAVQILERRFAEGALTLEDYRARREVLVNGTAEPNAASTARRGRPLTQDAHEVTKEPESPGDAVGPSKEVRQ